MITNHTSYVVISPARDEESHIRLTIESVVQQSVRPREWVIVDDGSTDDTGKVIDDYAVRYPWIRVVHRLDRGFRKSGGGVVDAFNAGLRALHCSDWEFLVKLDADLIVRPDYFEKCLEEFNQNRGLGIGGGVVCHVVGEETIVEQVPQFHVRGATKIYRKACWTDIGGLWPVAGWDTMDEVKANSLGWTTRSFPQLHLVHQRETGAADGQWRTFVKYGRANYICGYHPLFMTSKCVARLFRRPYVIGAIGLLFGYISGYLMKVPQIDDHAAIKYLREQQIRKLLGKATIWR